MNNRNEIIEKKLVVGVGKGGMRLDGFHSCIRNRQKEKEKVRNKKEIRNPINLDLSFILTGQFQKNREK